MKKSNEVHLTDEVALRIGSAIYRDLLSDGLSASICVVDASGRIRFAMSMANARPFTADVARLKAQQAASTGVTTRQARDEVAAGDMSPTKWGIPQSEFIHWAGGVPIYSPQQTGSDNQRIRLGGVGVSNLPQNLDESYAIAGVLKAGFYPYRTDGLLGENPEGIRYVHHLGVGLPNAETVEEFVTELLDRGATIVTQDGHKYFLRLNPEDTLQIEIFVESDAVDVHVDYAVTDLETVRELYSGGNLENFGLTGVEFLLIEPGQAVECLTTEIAFSSR